MSTYIYLECLDHNPPLQAADESGQHLYNLPRIHAEIAHRDQLVAAYLNDELPLDLAAENTNDYFQVHSARFLAEHPKCRIGIRDEYGNEHPTEDREDDRG